MQNIYNIKEKRFLSYLCQGYRANLQVYFKFQLEHLDLFGIKDIYEFDNLLMDMTIRGYIKVIKPRICCMDGLAEITLTNEALNKFNYRQ